MNRKILLFIVFFCGMGFLHNTAAQGTDQFFQYKDYDNINRAAPSGPGGGGDMKHTLTEVLLQTTT